MAVPGGACRGGPPSPVRAAHTPGRHGGDARGGVGERRGYARLGERRGNARFGAGRGYAPLGERRGYAPPVGAVSRQEFKQGQQVERAAGWARRHDQTPLQKGVFPPKKNSRGSQVQIHV